MKNLIKGIVIGLLLTSAVAFKAVSDYQAKKSTAEVDQEGGIYIFIRSKPVLEFDFLGKVDMPGVVMTGKPKEMINTALKRAAKQFPEANALIFQSEDFSKVDAIKIK